MSFEEEFPSLEECDIKIGFPTIHGKAPLNDELSKKILMENCLDKARVKKAWIKLLKACNEEHSTNNAMGEITDFEKELGL